MTHARPLITWAGCTLLLLLFAARLLMSAEHASYTVDEPHYVGVGLYLWETGDYHYFETLKLHPPLTFHLASLPLLALDMGRETAFIHGPRADVVRFASRVPFVLLALWGALLCFLWAREAAGDEAGLLALFLVSFSPMMLAHGSLVHTDITVTVLYVQTLYAAWRMLRAPTPTRVALCGVSLGLALIAKLSAVLLLVILPAILLRHILKPLPDARSFGTGFGTRLARAAGIGAGLLVCCVVVFWLGYGGSFATLPVASGLLEGMVLPGYVHSFLLDHYINAEGRETYLLGEFDQKGWWYFFPAAFAIKSPLGVLALLGVALWRLLTGTRRLGPFLALPFAVYLGFACFYLDVPLGLRYVLPVYPLVFVFIATQVAPFDTTPVRAIIAGACVWIAAASLWIHPHYLAYFNEAVGGPRNGPDYLLDANIDWGQDLGTLAEWLEERGSPPVRLAYFGPERPERYGIRHSRLPGCRPVSGLIAISVNNREHLYTSYNALVPPTRDCYRWLDAYEPIARPGWSILVYDIPE